MMKRFFVLVVTTLLAAGCGRSSDTAGKAEHPAGGGQSAAAGDVILFEGMGPHTRAVSGASPEAQRYFDQGLDFYFGFNHDEAKRAFGKAAELSPDCAMAYWGLSLANGPHINNPTMDEAHVKGAMEALAQARAREANASDLERALIECLGKRYADPQPEDRHPLDQAYADAMAEVWKAHPDDADVGSLYAEALMDLRPWDLWTADGQPQPGTDLVVSTLETVLAMAPEHPFANHLYIHAVEPSPHPEKAIPSADRLRDLMPAVSHMVHMPSHIDIRVGQWAKAQTANEKAIAADRRYREQVPHLGFYRLYMAHNSHMLAYAAMMQGESALAIATVKDLVAAIPPDWAKENAGFCDGFLAMPYETEMRFGHWDEILAEPDLDPVFPLSRALRLYARGVAYAAKGMVPQAQAEQKAFLAARAQVPDDAFFFNNTAHALLDVAEHLLAGEILFRDGKLDAGLDEMREAVRREDMLRYDEPPDWIQPVRHALGASLLMAGKAEEAEAVYREDLRRLPENGWSLFGLGRSLRLQDKDAEAQGIEARFQEIWKNADVKLSSSCFCQPGV